MLQGDSSHVGSFEVGWSEGGSNGESSLELKEKRSPVGSKATLKNDLSWRLEKLYTDILSTADIVNQVQIEVLWLRKENETLRKKLSLIGASVAEGEEPGLDSSADFVSTVVGKKSDGPRASAVPALMERPELKVDLQHAHEEEVKEAETALPSHIRRVSEVEESVQSLKGLALRDDGSASVPPESSTTFIKTKKQTSFFVSPDQEASFLLSRVSKPASQEHEKSGTSSAYASFAVSSRFSEEIKSSRHAPENSNSVSLSQFLGNRAKGAQGTRRTGVRAMLFDPDMVKQKLRDNIVKPDRNITRLYYQKGLAQVIARSRIFEMISMGFICANTLWIAVDTEHNQADVLLDADIGFQVVEHIFCTFFFLEILIRFAAFERKRNCIRSGWFIFDGLLVFTMVVEDWFMTIMLLSSRGGPGGTGKSVSAIKNTSTLRVLRLLRILRLGRCIRMMRQSPELMIMVKAVWGAMRSVVWTCVLLAGVTFVFAVCFTQLCKDTGLEDDLFPSLTGSLHTLLIAGMFPDLETKSKSINSESIFFWLMFMLYMITTSICVLNMLIGVLVEVVKNSSMIERDAMDVNYVKEVFVTHLELTEVDDITNIFISKQLALELLQEAEISDALTRVGIDILGLVDLMDFIFIKGEVSIASLLEIVLQLRSSAALTVKDVVEVRKFLTFEINNMKHALKQIRNSNHLAIELGFGVGRQESALDKKRDAGFMKAEARPIKAVTESLDTEMTINASQMRVMRV